MLSNILQLIRRLVKHKRQVNHPPNEPVANDIRYDLPPEVWLLIWEYLKLSDAISLAFVSMAMYRLFWKRILQELKEPQYKIAEPRFLLRSDVYKPRHRFCFSCMEYHRRCLGSLRLHTSCFLNLLRGYSLTPLAQLANLGLLDFPWVHMVMRAHRHKSLKYGISLRRFERHCQSCHEDSFQPMPFSLLTSKSWHWSYRAAITAGDDPHLLLRSQAELFPPKVDAFFTLNVPFGPITPYAYLDCVGFPGCHHAHTDYAQCPGRENIADVWRSRERDNTAYLSLRRKCKYCPSEYFIESYRDMLRVTVWTDLGNGMSPWEGEWDALTTGLSREALVGEIFEPVPRDRLSIQERFDTALKVHRRS